MCRETAYIKSIYLKYFQSSFFLKERAVQLWYPIGNYINRIAIIIFYQTENIGMESYIELTINKK